MRLISARVVVASALLAVAVSACVVAPAPGYHAVIAYEAPPPGTSGWAARGSG